MRLRAAAPLRAALAGLVAVLGLATLAAAVTLWPRGPLPHPSGVPQVRQDDVSAQVVTVHRRSCAGTSDDRTAAGAVAAAVACAAVDVRLLAGPDSGRVVPVQVTGATAGEVAAGQRVTVARFPDTPLAGGGDDTTTTGPGADPAASPRDLGTVYAWVDFDRSRPMLLLAGVFALVVLLIARLRGLAALAGVVAGFAMVTVFLLPALQRGGNPVLVPLVGCAAVMLVVLYSSHGVSAKTTSAYLGTLTALAVTAGLAVWATGAGHLDGQTGEDALALTQLVGAPTIRAAVVSGLVLAGLGVLNDVTVTQASAVWELRAAAPQLGARALFGRGMRIGRDHLASTVYTIAFAYAGLSLPVLLLIQVYDRPLGEVLTSAAVAQDVVGVLVAGIGLALAIPLTTAVSALVASACRTVPVEPARVDRPAPPAPLDDDAWYELQPGPHA